MNILPNYFNAKGPGAAIAVTRDGQSPHVECVGLADIEAGIEITPNTVFDLASGTKMFTATAVLLLAERGELDLLAPVTDFLPQFSASKAGRAITVQDLLAHTSGLSDYLELGMHTPAEQMSSEYVWSQLPVWSQEAVPGQNFSYLNTNYVVLAGLIESIAGCSYRQFLESQLFAPLGLRNTFVGGTLTDQTFAKGYQNFGYGLPSFAASEHFELDTVGDGGVFSSLHDLLIWQSAFWQGEIINEASLQKMLEPGKLDSGERFEYGLGMQVEERCGGQIWCGHGGSWTSSTTLFGRYLRENTSVIVLSNEIMAPVERISQQLK